MRRYLLLPIVFAPALAAQVTPPPTAPPAMVAAALSGTVYDSLKDGPLQGATVVLSGSSITATTDSVGRYSFELDSVSEGWHKLSFFHPSLDSLGIAAPPQRVELHRGSTEVVDLAVPSGATIIAAFCPDSTRGAQRALIMGEVRDADADHPLPGALVVAMWSSMEIGNNTIARLPRALNARADSNGFFRLCGLPAGTPLRAQARLNSKASGWFDLSLAPRGVTVLQLLVGERPAPAKTIAIAVPAASAPKGTGTTAATSAPRTTGTSPAAATSTAVAVPLGTSSLTGTVMNGEGTPMEGAQVFVDGTNLMARADSRGIFRMSALPAGTQTVEVRLLSYQPKRYRVNLAPKTEAHLNAVLDQRAQVLDPVVVTGKDVSGIPGFEERQLHASGTFFTAAQLHSASSNNVTEFLRMVPGLTVAYVSGKGNGLGENTVVATRALSQCTEAQWYLDGAKYEMTQEDLDDVFKPTELEGIEVYTSVESVPAQFQGPLAACGTILIWTKRAHVKPKPPAPAAPPPPSTP